MRPAAGALARLLPLARTSRDAIVWRTPRSMMQELTVHRHGTELA
jgi:hypothetical protein